MGDSQLCVTVSGRTTDAMRAGRAVAEAHADLVELRLDLMERPSIAALLDGRTRPVIVTCRPVREGGQFAGTEEERRQVLAEADREGAEFLDIEFESTLLDLLSRRNGRGVIVSKHDFRGVSDGVPRLLAAMRETGAQVAKLAVTATTLADMIPLLESARFDGSQVLIAMGTPGVASRILAAQFGSRWTYAGDEAAPGQLPPSRLLSEFRFARIRRDSAVYGIIGRPVSHSLSPAMHNAGFAALGLNAAYVPFEAADIADFRMFAETAGVRGVSVTAPFKIAVVDMLDEVTPVARDVRAVNTVTWRDGRWIGTNTDIDGFLDPLRRRGGVRGRTVLVLGAGGAARAVVAGLRLEGADVSIAARRSPEAMELADWFGARAIEWPPTGVWDVVVNATPVGSAASPGLPTHPGDTRAALAYDLVYAPRRTAFLGEYEAAGAEVVGGLEMLIAQAERQFEIWTGQRPPQGLFEAAVMGHGQAV
jgi:3-dehydroquinate dehydratase/shikimate dehydrogenase